MVAEWRAGWVEPRASRRAQDRCSRPCDGPRTPEVPMKGQLLSASRRSPRPWRLPRAASGMTRAERLSLYEAMPASRWRGSATSQPQGWEEIDDDHIVVTMRPTESYLMRLSGPCLDYDNGAAAMLITTQTGSWIQAKFDRVCVRFQHQLPHRGDPPARRRCAAHWQRRRSTARRRSDGIRRPARRNPRVSPRRRRTGTSPSRPRASRDAWGRAATAGSR